MRVRVPAKFVLFVLGTSLMMTGAATTATAAGADPTLIGWTAQADANPFDFVIDSTPGLDGAHPIDEADLPEDTSTFETGPFGYGLASVFWPGAVAGNLTSLAGEVGFPSQLAPLFENLNDPVKAETFYPEGPQMANYPQGSSSGVAEMTSYSDSNGSWAKAGLSDVSIPGLFDIQGVRGSTTATATSLARSTATSTFSSLSLLGGLVQIGASVSRASASSNGVNPTGNADTHIGAITVAGNPVTLGSDGLAVGPAQTNLLGPLLAPSVALTNQIISIFDLKMTPLPETETRQAPSEQITSGGLKLSFTLPSSASLSVDCAALPSALAQLGLLCHLPDVLQGATFTATIARATATAIASPGFGAVVTPSASVPPAGLPSAAQVLSGPAVSSESAPTQALPLGTLTTSASPAMATSPTAQGAGSPPQPSDSGVPRLISLSSPLKAGFLGFLLALAVLTGSCLRRMLRALDAPPPSSCPLEDLL